MRSMVIYMKSGNVEQILAIVKTISGVDLSGYRRSMLERRIRARMVRLGIAGCDDYIGLLQGDCREAEQLLDGTR